MYVGSGNALMEMLMKAKANCLNCGKEMVFEDAGRRAKDLGITDNVLMCGGCRHIFTCTLVPGRLTLNSDVTSKYPQAPAAEVKAEKTDAEPEKKAEKKPEPKPQPKPESGTAQKAEETPVPKKGFFARLFGK